jgi:hypothetical protein
VGGQRDVELQRPPARLVDLVGLALQRAQQRVQARGPRGGREQRLADLAAALQQRDAAGHQRAVRDLEELRVDLLREPVQRAVQRHRVDDLPVGIQQRVLAALAPDQLQRRPVELQQRADAQVAVGPRAFVLRPRVDPEQECRQSPARR